MRGTIALLGTLLSALLLLAACAKPMYVRNEQRLSFYEAPAKRAAYLKTSAIAIKPAPDGVDRGAADLFLKTVAQSFRDADRRLILLTPEQPEYPAFMRVYAPISNLDAFAAAQIARREGFHSLLQAAVANKRVYEKKTGIWWFRKNRYFLTVVVSLEAFDTFTGAKIFDEVREQTVKIDSAGYAAINGGAPASDNEAFNDLLVEMAEDLGEQVADVVAESKWIASVADVQNPHITLKPGGAAGLKVGDRLGVYEGRRVVEGLDGEKFIVPGYKVAEVQITAVDEDGAQASYESTADIRPGDIAVPAK